MTREKTAAPIAMLALYAKFSCEVIKPEMRSPVLYWVYSVISGMMPYMADRPKPWPMPDRKVTTW